MRRTTLLALAALLIACGASTAPAVTAPVASSDTPSASSPPSPAAPVTLTRPASSASACAGTPVDVQPLAMIATEGGGKGGCGTKTQLTGRAKAGEECQHAIECEPVCCACADPSRSARAAWCKEGRCAGADDVCCGVAGTKTRSCGSSP